MSTNQVSNDPLENLIQATAHVGERIEEHAVNALETTSEVVMERASNVADVVSEKTTNLVDKTVEKTAENSTKQEVIEIAAEKGQTNVAASYAAASTTVAADSQLSDSQKTIIEARMKEITLAQENEIAPKVAINEQQRIQEKNHELSA